MKRPKFHIGPVPSRRTRFGVCVNGPLRHLQFPLDLKIAFIECPKKGLYLVTKDRWTNGCEYILKWIPKQNSKRRKP